MNYNYPTTIYRSIKVYRFLVVNYIFTVFAYDFFMVKIKKNIINTTLVNVYVDLVVFTYTRIAGTS